MMTSAEVILIGQTNLNNKKIGAQPNQRAPQYPISLALTHLLLYTPRRSAVDTAVFAFITCMYLVLFAQGNGLMLRELHFSFFIFVFCLFIITDVTIAF